MSAAALLRVAAGEIGYTENPPGSNRTKYADEVGHINGYPWCASFIVWCCHKALVELPSESAYTPSMAVAFQKAGQWSTSPQPGDICFFDFPDSKRRIQHVGIVESHTHDTVTCVEGNTSSGWTGSQDNGGGVYRRTRPRTHVVGFGRPDFEEDDMLTDEQAEQLATANHFVKVIWPEQIQPVLAEIRQHLDVLMKGVPDMQIPPVPKTIFEIHRAVVD